MKLALFFAPILAAFASFAFAQSSTTNASSSITPSQAHLAYHGTNGMTVSWSTHAQLAKPTVKYGLLPWLLIFEATSTESVTYNTSTIYLNHVIVSNLLPDTTYYYSLSNSNTVYNFKTAMIAGDPRPYTAAVVVDMGAFGPLGLSTTNPTSDALKPGEITTPNRLKMDMNLYDHILHPGDLAYADAWKKEEKAGYLPNNPNNSTAEYEAINEAFYDDLTPFSAYRPYHVSAGNHEANCIDAASTTCQVGQTNFTGYINRFRMPSDVSGGVGNFWYSFDYGMTHYVFYNTETDLGGNLIGPDEPGGSQGTNAGPFGAPNQQINFLKNDLAKVNRKITPWIVALGHRPWYVAQPAASLCTVCQQAFEQIFYENNVDLVVSGHVHATERNHPIYNGTIDPALLNNPRAPWYITNGAAGHYDGLDTLTTPYPSYVAFANDTLYSYSRLTFHNRTHCEFPALFILD